MSNVFTEVEALLVAHQRSHAVDSIRPEYFESNDEAPSLFQRIAAFFDRIGDRMEGSAAITPVEQC